jgi:hypothetical protein
MADSALTDFTASSSAIGYLYQVRLALVFLLRQDNPETILSIEKFDDIAFETNGEASELLQTKHHVNHTGSLTDSSEDLWKTIRVWTTAIRSGVFDPNSPNLLSLITTGQAPTGSAASFLRGNSHRDENKALELILAAGASSRNSTVKISYNEFVAFPQPQQRSLIARIRIIDAAPDIGGARELLEKELRLSTRPKFLGPLCDRLEGWWFRSVIEHLARPDQISGISQRLAQVQLNDLQDQFREDNLPIDFPSFIQVDESALETDERVFVEQLKLLSITTERIQRAISDYYRAFHQRSRWVREDLLLDEDLERYEERLVEEWRNLFLIMQEKVQAGNDVVGAGRDLYNDLFYTSRHIPIRPSFPDPFVMRGSFHMLANSLKVGWHSEFENRLAHLLNRALEPA